MFGRVLEGNLILGASAIAGDVSPRELNLSLPSYIPGPPISTASHSMLKTKSPEAGWMMFKVWGWGGVGKACSGIPRHSPSNSQNTFGYLP